MEPATISIESFRSKNAVLIGDLGFPLGTPLEIEATVVEAMNPLIADMPTGDYRLKVNQVGGRDIKPSPSLGFVVYHPGKNVAVAANEVEFKELVRRLQEPDNFFGAKPLSPSATETFERAFVGSRHKLGVYEAAGFDGLPVKLPEGVNTWSAPGFGPHTYLVVLIERKS